jgi:phage shock protein A
MTLNVATVAELKQKARDAVTRYNENDAWRAASYTQQLLQNLDNYEKQMVAHGVDQVNFPPQEESK